MSAASVPSAYLLQTRARLRSSVSALEDEVSLLSELLLRKHYKNNCLSKLCGVYQDSSAVGSKLGGKKREATEMEGAAKRPRGRKAMVSVPFVANAPAPPSAAQASAAEGAAAPILTVPPSAATDLAATGTPVPDSTEEISDTGKIIVEDNISPLVEEGNIDAISSGEED